MSPESVAAYGEAAPRRDGRRSRCRQASCRASAGCTSSCRRPRSSASAKARATSSSIRTAAWSSARRARSCWRWRPISATRSSLPGHRRDAICEPRCRARCNELEKFQCPSGGFAFWPGECRTVSPYPHQLRAAASTRPRATLKYDRRRRRDASGRTTISQGELARAAAGQRRLVAGLHARGRRSPSRCSSRAAGTRTRTSTGSTAISIACRCSRSRTCTTRWRRRATAVRALAELRRRMDNAILPEAGSAHVEELTDPYLLWFWNSNIRIDGDRAQHAGASRRGADRRQRRWSDG